MTALNLQTTLELKSTLYDVMNDGVLVVDEQGMIIDCNPAFHQRLGYTKEQLVGRSVAAIDSPEYAARVPERLRQIRRDGQATFETAHVHRDGSVMPVELNARYCNVGGELVFFSIVRDISERRKLTRQLREGIEVYQAAINTTALGFWVVDMQGCFLEVNDTYVEMSGYTREELLLCCVSDVEAQEHPEQTRSHIEHIMRDGYDRFRSKHRRKDGSVWPVEIVCSFSAVQGGRFFVFIEDISERMAQERRLEVANHVIESMDQAVVVTDADNRIVSVNPAATRITGYPMQEMLGRNPSIFSSGRNGPDFYREMWEALQRDDHWEGEIWDRRKDGTLHAKWLTINVIRDALGEVYQYASVFSDITERKRTEEIIWRQANFDSLTGLPNRHLLHERLEQEIKKAQRGDYPLALLFIDLDRFKAVNDSLGHAKGDELLALAARRIESRVRETDTIARLGGDEFTVVLPDFGSRGNLERIAQELIHDLSEPYQLGDDQAYVSASIGITLFPEDADSLETLLRHADQAMYVAKAEGRNRFGYFTESMQREARGKIALTNDLRQALALRQLEVYYQPIVDLQDGRIRKAEALLRWHHPVHGMVSPMVFIPLAEDTGLIHGIGAWVFSQVLQDIMAWRSRFGCTVQVSVNKSPLQFERQSEPRWTEQLERLGLPGDCINVEITEGSLLSKSQRIRDSLLEYRNAGVEVSIDDFGTGYSALSYLRQFDIDYLKIDRSFISDLEEDEANTALTEAIIVMAHKLGIKAIAEGVETERQRDLLRGFGCDYAQGYLYSPPVPAARFADLIADQVDCGKAG